MVKKEYSLRKALLGPEQPLYFKEDRISLNVPISGKKLEGWILKPAFKPKVINNTASVIPYTRFLHFI